MNYSPSREIDRKDRILMLECMEIALRNGFIEEAKAIGENSRIMADKIKNKDYSREDAWLEKENSLKRLKTT